MSWGSTFILGEGFNVAFPLAIFLYLWNLVLTFLTNHEAKVDSGRQRSNHFKLDWWSKSNQVNVYIKLYAPPLTLGVLYIHTFRIFKEFSRIWHRLFFTRCNSGMEGNTRVGIWQTSWCHFWFVFYKAMHTHGFSLYMSVLMTWLKMITR